MKKSDLEPKIELVTLTQALCYSKINQLEEEISIKSDFISNLQAEVKSLYEQLKSTKEENLDLLTELETLRESLNTDSIYEFLPGSSQLSEKVEACQTLRKNAESNADFFKEELDKKIQEIKDLRKELEKSKENSKNTFNKDELKQLVIMKNEQIKSLNKKFQVMVAKIDALTKEKENLENINKGLESEKKKLTERWHESEIDILIKRNQELYTKQVNLQTAKENDSIYIEKLKEEILKIQTKYQILQDERDILAKLNEELSISNNLKDAQICKSKTARRPTDEYQSAVEMNANLEYKLEKCEAEIRMLRFQLNRKNQEIEKLESEFSSIKENPARSKDVTQEFNNESFPSHNEMQELVEDFKLLLDKYKKCKGKKNSALEACEKMKDKVCELSAQVQSDQYLIKHLQERSRVDTRVLNDSRSVSSFRLRSKEMAG